jgi:hypothetical protein
MFSFTQSIKKRRSKLKGRSRKRKTTKVRTVNLVSRKIKIKTQGIPKEPSKGKLLLMVNAKLSDLF